MRWIARLAGAALAAFLLPSGLAGADPSPPARVDLNRASVELLTTLPGIGEKRAAAIVALRERRGGLRSVEELAAIPGLGGRRLAQLRPLVTVSTPPAKAAAARPQAPGGRGQNQATPSPRGSW